MDLPVIGFIQARLQEANPNFDTREGTAFYDLFVEPQELMLTPITSALADFQISQSIATILALPSPDTYSTAAVDNLLSNLYVTRSPGQLATTNVRVWYETPLDKQYPALTAQFTAGTLSFFNSSAVAITAQQMALQTDGTLYYVDIPAQSQTNDSTYNSTVAGTITAFVNDADAVKVSNTTPIVGGLPTQTNTQILTQAKNSIAVRDLETVKGINAILTQNFPSITEIQPIGMGDPEMQRDILYNVHVGGKTDVYIKVPSLVQQTPQFIGIPYDPTRSLARSFQRELATSISDQVLDPDFLAPNIVTGSVKISDGVIETAAFVTSLTIPPSVGIDLSSQQWIRMNFNGGPFVQFKVAGATPANTQLFEIVDSINSNLGLDLAVVQAGPYFILTSPTVGALSTLQFTAPVSPVLSGNNAAIPIFGFATATITGIGAAVYTEDVDYTVDYLDGLIYQTLFVLFPTGTRVAGTPSIVSGQTMIASATDGQIIAVGPLFQLQSTVTNRFLDDPLVHVRAGDAVTIEEIDGDTAGTVLGTLPQTFIVGSVVNNQTLSLVGFNPSGVPISPNTVQYSIVSHQVVNVSFEYNPLAIDIGNNVLLADGFNRGVRPGRSAFTIQAMPFLNIVSIQEIDPNSLELIGNPLQQNEGYGWGGYGGGGYGEGTPGDFQFIVNDPTCRFSMFEDSLIAFNSPFVGQSFQIVYNSISELAAVHAFCRNDGERVTGADVLPKNFVPCYVDIPIVITRDPTNLTTPSDAALAVLVNNYVNTVAHLQGVKASAIVALLEAQGVADVQLPFTMTGTVYNTDGSTSILTATDVLIFPPTVLLSQADNYSTPNIVHFYPGNISVTEPAS